MKQINLSSLNPADPVGPDNLVMYVNPADVAALRGYTEVITDTAFTAPTLKIEHYTSLYIRGFDIPTRMPHKATVLYSHLFA